MSTEGSERIRAREATSVRRQKFFQTVGKVIGSLFATAGIGIAALLVAILILLPCAFDTPRGGCHLLVWIVVVGVLGLGLAIIGWANWRIWRKSAPGKPGDPATTEMHRNRWLH